MDLLWACALKLGGDASSAWLASMHIESSTVNGAKSPAGTLARS